MRELYPNHHEQTQRLCVRRAWNVFKASMFLARNTDKEIIIFQKADKATLIYAYLLTRAWWYYSGRTVDRCDKFTFEILRIQAYMYIRIILRFTYYYRITNSTNRNFIHSAAFTLAEYIYIYLLTRLPYEL